MKISGKDIALMSKMNVQVNLSICVLLSSSFTHAAAPLFPPPSQTKTKMIPKNKNKKI
jgi:hypothetical protein